MSYILDTHFVLWTLFEPGKIDKDILAILENEDITKLVSAISLWEISLKYSLGKLELFNTNPDEVCQKIVDSGFEILSVEDEIFASYYKLPKKERHKDPFDRLLIWQSIQHDLTVITKDDRMVEYVKDGLKLKLGG